MTDDFIILKSSQVFPFDHDQRLRLEKHLRELKYLKTTLDYKWILKAEKQIKEIEIKLYGEQKK